MSHIKSRVLILDADMIPCLSIVRSLARQGIICDIASSGEAKALTHYSRHVNRAFRYPDPLAQAEAFVDFIATHLQQHDYDLVIPVTERSLVPLATTDKLEKWAHILAIAPRDSLNKALDKAQTLLLAEQCAVSVPFSYAVVTVDEISALLPKLTFPVVLKPGRSIANAEQRKQLSVAYAFDGRELLNLSADLLKSGELLLQQYVQGDGVGIELLADHGEIVYAFQHQRLHEVPLTGGGSSFRKSVAVEPVLLAAAQRLIKALSWHGVAMVEFKWLPETGDYWLMEINGRFWGSLPLACAAGADFPALLYDLWVLKRRPASGHYRAQVYCRKLSSDIYWYEQVLRRSEDPRLVTYPNKKQLLDDALLALHPLRHAFDVQQWRDPVPGLIDLAQIIATNGRRLSGLLALKWLYKKHRSRAMQQRLQRQLQTARTVLFVCYGNINRSAVAQVLAESAASNTNVRFMSAGFHPVCGRPADANMVNVAATHGVDLSACRSKTVDKAMIAESDLIFVMEMAQLQRIQADFPETVDKAFLLGTLIADQTSRLDIDDPYNREEAVYKHCFITLNTACAQLAQSITF
jgi:protein-tyrosine-phosphatase/biotin carboxylase